MENYAGPGFGVQNGTLAEATNPDVPVKLIAVDDIGAFVRLAFNDPETFLGKTLEIAGDALTPTQIAEAIARATGRSVRYVHIPIDAVRFRSMPCAGRTRFWPGSTNGSLEKAAKWISRQCAVCIPV
jgi:uncharacterized protein YbjT (DUF2867 family)